MIKYLMELFNSLPDVLRSPLRFGVGWLLILLGVVGMLIPILPGTPFVLLGGWMLGWKFSHVRTLLARYPVIQQYLPYLPFQLGKMFSEPNGPR